MCRFWFKNYKYFIHQHATHTPNRTSKSTRWTLGRTQRFGRRWRKYWARFNCSIFCRQCDRYGHTSWLHSHKIRSWNSLRAALKSQGETAYYSYLLNKIDDNLFLPKEFPGKGILLLRPFGSVGHIAAPIFPLKGMIGNDWWLLWEILTCV